jgi:hypothetical protein
VHDTVHDGTCITVQWAAPHQPLALLQRGFLGLLERPLEDDGARRLEQARQTGAGDARARIQAASLRPARDGARGRAGRRQPDWGCAGLQPARGSPSGCGPQHAAGGLPRLSRQWTGAQECSRSAVYSLAAAPGRRVRRWEPSTGSRGTPRARAAAAAPSARGAGGRRRTCRRHTAGPAWRGWGRARRPPGHARRSGALPALVCRHNGLPSWCSAVQEQLRAIMTCLCSPSNTTAQLRAAKPGASLSCVRGHVCQSRPVF